MKSRFTIQENVSLAEKTTLKIGGAARFFIEAKSESDVADALRFAEENDLNIFILGGGSNVLIADEGFNGLVLQIALKGISTFEQPNEIIRVTAQAGEDWDEFVRFCVAENLAGIECLSGIPGFVGGTPVQNVGAYGQEVSETIASVRVFDRKTKNFVDLSNSQCHFAYRTSIFNTSEKNRYIVLAVTYELTSGGAPKIVYADLKKYFGEHAPDLAETRRVIIEIRAAKSMVIDERDPNSKSAGSFFKNPIVSNEKFAEILEKAQKSKIENVPGYKVDDRSVKVPAAWLIENSGFQKGYKKGNAGLSTRHTLAVVNLGSASAGEILALKEEIQAKVKNIFDVRLETEPIFVGFPGE
ncbi:MAG TPA: UDP-N-acetylmuramate dehydrogenase [Pyrinomonadaceae bacterium]|jgi:UDP-N-acetylmuramate dehydrogenase